MGKLLYVTNISFEATEDDLRTMFSVAGTVRSIKLLTDPVATLPNPIFNARLNSVTSASIEV